MSSWRGGENLYRGEVAQAGFPIPSLYRKRVRVTAPPGRQFILRETKEMKKKYCVIPEWLI
jgi:hypothetical protein